MKRTEEISEAVRKVNSEIETAKNFQPNGYEKENKAYIDGMERAKKVMVESLTQYTWQHVN